MKRIHVIHGPNLDVLGERESDFYGDLTLLQLNDEISRYAEKLGLDVTILQSNRENEIVDAIRRAATSADGLIINPAGLGYSSLALRDAVLMCRMPVIEVHLSNIHARETFRQRTMIADVCTGQIAGFRHFSYLAALSILAGMLTVRK